MPFWSGQKALCCLNRSSRTTTSQCQDTEKQLRWLKNLIGFHRVFVWDVGSKLDMFMLLTNFELFADILLEAENKVRHPSQFLLSNVTVAIKTPTPG